MQTEVFNIFVGVLSLQGDVIEHINYIKKLNYIPIEVKDKEDLELIDALILPGGESTTIGRLLRITGLGPIIKDKIENGLPVWGTCAGMILLANEIENQQVSYLGVIDIKVKRNAYGSQLDSFKTSTISEKISNEPIEMPFIRAPYIVDIGKDVEPLIYVDDNLVAARQKNILVTSFHPELTDNTVMLKYFLNKF